MSFCIIGSCVTRDIWEYADHAYNGRYFARTSFGTLMLPPKNISHADLAKLDSNFQRLSVIYDASRAALRWILENKPKHIFIDFIDERFDMVRLPDGTLLNNSFELRTSGYVQSNFPKSLFISKSSKEGRTLWADGFEKFIISVRLNSPDTKVVLHKAWFQTQIQESAGVTPWTTGINIPSRTLEVNDCNYLMKELYAKAESLGVDFVVEADAKFQLSAGEHRWGRHQVHYVPSYYRDCWSQIRAILAPYP